MSEGKPHVLVVEDGLLIAMETQSQVEECGCAVVGPVGTVGEALGAARQAPLDGALLDINLGGERVWPVAELLAQRGVPFLLVSGYSEAELPARSRNVPLLSKPISLEALGRLLRQVGTIRA